MTYSYPMVTYSDPKMTLRDPRVTYSHLNVTYSDPKHLPLLPPTSPEHEGHFIDHPLPILA